MLLCKSVLLSTLNALKLAGKVAKYYELGVDRLADIYKLSIVVFKLRPFDQVSFRDSPSNYIIDLQDYCGESSIGNIRSITSELVQQLVSSIDPALSSLSILVLTSLCLLTGTGSNLPQQDQSDSDLETALIQQLD